MIIKNRFGRIVSVSEELGKYMIKEDGATLFEPETEKEEETNTESELKCPYCDKVCLNQLGYNKHTEACKKKATSSQL